MQRQRIAEIPQRFWKIQSPSALTTTMLRSRYPIFVGDISLRNCNKGFVACCEKVQIHRAMNKREEGKISMR